MEKIHFKIVLFIIFFISFYLPFQAVESSGNPVSKYIPVAEYLKLHPKEQNVSERFGQIVMGSAQPIPSSSQEKNIKIAIVYPGEQVSDYWRRSLLSFEGRMQELQIPYEICQHFTRGGGVETRNQARLLKEVLAENPDYLFFTLDVKRHKRLIERILAKGKPHLFLQNITTPLTAWEGNQPFYVGFDHTIGTEILAEYFLKKYGSEGSYGLLYYSQGYVSTMRGDTFLNIMRQKNGPQLAASFYTEGSRAKATTATLNGLTKIDDLKFIYACATDVSFGAVDGLKEGGRAGEITVNGWGGGDAELAAVARGDLDVTVMRMNDDNGVAMAEAIRLKKLGRENEVPTIFSGEFVLVTRQTTIEELNTLKQKAFRYSGIPGMQ
jgi:autoinducer 2-binding periplasmic protein LuxP